MPDKTVLEILQEIRTMAYGEMPWDERAQRLEKLCNEAIRLIAPEEAE